MLNNKKYITCIEIFLVLYILVGGFFIFKILNDRISYLNRNITREGTYTDLTSDNIKESFIVRNKNVNPDDILVSDNVDNLQLDNVVDKNNTKFFSSSFIGCNECTQIKLKIMDELNYSTDSNVIIVFNKQGQR